MIKVTVENGSVLCVAELNGRFGVYLDTDSLIDLAKKSECRRQRFLRALHEGGDLLFSLINALEIAGTAGDTAAAIRGFLDGVGPYWTPLESNPWKLVRREAAGILGQGPISESFMKAYFEERSYDLTVEGHEVVALPADSFFRLGSVLDWVQEHRDAIRCHAVKIDHTFCSRMKQLCDGYDKNPSSLDLKCRLCP